ncbi:MAG: hypothetical protein LBW85_10590 [Deltaproteobacteria bacterium]|nr:hypothetical protein [Deltaproteobacteria bacterium]
MTSPEIESLTPEQFQQEIAGPSRKPYYLVKGGEPLGMAACLKAASEVIRGEARAFNLHTYWLGESSAAEAVGAASGSSLFSSSPRIVIIKIPPVFKSGYSELSDSLAAWLKKPPRLVTVAIFQDKPDLRLRYCETARKAGTLVDCPPPDRMSLVPWIHKVFQSKGLRASEEAARVLADRAGGDSLQAIVNQVEKLSIWPGPGRQIGPAVIREQVPLSPAGVLYELGEPVGERRPQGAVPTLLNLLDSADAFPVLAAFSTHIRKLYAAKVTSAAAPLEGKAPDAAALEFGMKGYGLSRIRAQASRWSLAELRAAVSKTEEAYRKLMTTSISPDIILEELCLGLSLPPPPPRKAAPVPPDGRPL